MKTISIKSLFVFLLSIAMILSISACGSGSSSDNTTDQSGAEATEAAAATDAPAATEAAAATEAPAASGDVVAAYVFTYTGSVDICELYLSATSQNNWGPDQLGGSTIPAGRSRPLSHVA